MSNLIASCVLYHSIIFCYFLLPVYRTIPSPPMLLSANPTPSPSSLPSPMPSPMSSPVVSTSGGPGSAIGSGGSGTGGVGGPGPQGGSNPPTAPSTPTPQDQLLSAPSILQLMKSMHVESQTSLAVQIKGSAIKANRIFIHYIPYIGYVARSIYSVTKADLCSQISDPRYNSRMRRSSCTLLVDPKYH